MLPRFSGGSCSLRRPMRIHVFYTCIHACMYKMTDIKGWGKRRRRRRRKKITKSIDHFSFHNHFVESTNVHESSFLFIDQDHHWWWIMIDRLVSSRRHRYRPRARFSRMYLRFFFLFSFSRISSFDSIRREGEERRERLTSHVPR